MNFKGVNIDNLNKKQIENNKKEIKILCFDLTNLSQRAQLLWCSIGVFVFYLLYGYLQELIFTLDGFRPFGWYLTLIQFAYYTIFGWIECRIKDFLAATLMCVGLALFTLADSMISPHFDSIGVMMISCALLCDGLIGNVQEKAMRQHKASNTEVVLFSYSIGFVYLFFILLATSDLQKGAAFCAEHPLKTYGYGLIFSLSGYLGIQIVLTLVQTCGAFVAATVTTCRKAMSILLSFLFFYKPFTFQYIWSGLLVVIGIYLNIYSKQRGGAGSTTTSSKGGFKKLWISVKQCWLRHNGIQRRLMTNV